MGANITWPKGKPIEVCWNIESSQTDAAKRGPVKTAIEQGWSRVSGVQFVGWDFTGDGKADGIAVGNSTRWARVSNGWNFGSVHPSTNGPFYPLI